MCVQASWGVEQRYICALAQDRTTGLVSVLPKSTLVWIFRRPHTKCILGLFSDWSILKSWHLHPVLGTIWGASCYLSGRWVPFSTFKIVLIVTNVLLLLYGCLKKKKKNGEPQQVISCCSHSNWCIFILIKTDLYHSTVEVEPDSSGDIKSDGLQLSVRKQLTPPHNDISVAQLV